MARKQAKVHMHVNSATVSTLWRGPKVGLCSRDSRGDVFTSNARITESQFEAKGVIEAQVAKDRWASAEFCAIVLRNIRSALDISSDIKVMR
jgi:hypothetical protein